MQAQIISNNGAYVSISGGTVVGMDTINNDNATNANLTGEVTSVGNAAVLGSFTSARLLGALTNETGTGVAVFSANPTFTGVPAAPTAATNTTQLATTAFVTTANATNANLTGPITSVGNATSIAAQTGTGTIFVVNTSPTLVTPVIGVATGTSLVLSSFLNEAKGADIASAATTDIGAATGNYVDVTGTTTITGLGTVQAGTRRIVRFTDALTLTHHATALILPGAVNRSTVAGDVAEFVSLGGGNWICTNYSPTTVTGTGANVLAASPTLTGVPAAPTAGAGTNTTQLATTAFVTAIDNNASYRTIEIAGGDHTSGKVAGTYSMGSRELRLSGVATDRYLTTFYLVGADFPTVNGIPTKLRIRAQLYTNDVAPTGDFTIGLYPFTRPAVSGGAGKLIYTLGTVVPGSNGATFVAPPADGSFQAVSAEFALPADGWYMIGIVTTTTVAVDAEVHVNAQLQMRNN